MYIHKIYELFIYTQVFIHKINHIQFILMLFMSILRVSFIKFSHTQVRFLMFHIGKIQAMVSTGNRLIITKVLEVHKIIAHGVKGGHFLNEFVDFRQQVSHSITGVKERVEREMHERLYRRPGTAFRSNKAQLLRGFKTAEERQIAKRWLYSQEAYVLGRQAPMVRGNSPG